MSFSKTCSNVKLEGNMLSASCLTASGGTKSSSLSLDKYTGNTDGFFDISGANYSGSGAQELSLVSRVVLTGVLVMSDGSSMRKSRLNLDNYIGNNSGTLAWVMPLKADFASSSSHLSLNSCTLTAICKKSDGTSARSSLDLSKCLSNRNGALDLVSSQGSQDLPALIELDGTLLKVQLKGEDGELYWNILDLNFHVRNDEGKLAWRTSA